MTVNFDAAEHFGQGAISIPASQISDFDAEVSNNASVAANTAKATNVSTALSIGTVTATTYGITSDGGADDVVLPEANTTLAGLLGADKWDEIVANTSKADCESSACNLAAGTTLNSAAIQTGADDDQPDDDSEVPDNITVSAGSVDNSDITLKTTPSTVTGRITYDATNDRLDVGDGVGTDAFYPGPHSTECASSSCDLHASTTAGGVAIQTGTEDDTAETDAKVSDDLTHATGSIDLETVTITNIIDDEVMVGTGAGTVGFTPLQNCVDGTESMDWNGTAFVCNTITGGSASDSFKTHDLPAGVDPVADSGTDTLTWSVTAPLTLTGGNDPETAGFGWSGTFPDAQIAASNVTQHEGSINALNLTNAPAETGATADQTQEEIEDIAGGMDLGTETRLTFTYNDTSGNFDIVVDDMNDDVPESGDFGNAAALESTGALSADVVGLAELADSACGTNQILEDQGAAWVCVNTPAGTVDTSGTPVLNDYARFTDADTIEGRSYAEVKADLDLEIGTDIDALGTDNSTAVTLAGEDFLSLSTQEITANQIDTANISDGTIDQADIDDTDTLAGNPTHPVNSVWFGTTGIIAEGSVADTNETLVTFANSTTDRTVTIPDESGTVCVGVTGAGCPAGGSGSAIIFDIGDDGGNDSTDLSEIATTGDTNAIFSESAADKMLIAVGNNWPTADTVTTNANLTGPVTSVGNATAIATDAITDAMVVDTLTASNYLPIQTIGIADNNIIEVDQAGGAASGETVRMTVNGIESRSDAEMKTQLGYLTASSEVAMAGDASGTAAAVVVDDVQSATTNTEAADNNTTQVASTAFVQQEISNAVVDVHFDHADNLTELNTQITANLADGAHTINDGFGYDEIQDNDVAETKRPILNLLSGGTVTVACVDDAGNTETDCTFTGSAHTTAGDITLVGDVSGAANSNTVDDVQSATANTEAADNNTTQVASTAFVQQEISNDTTHASLAGRAGGQTLIGGTGVGDDLTLQTTSNASKGSYILTELDCSSGDQYITSNASGVLSCGTDNSGGGATIVVEEDDSTVDAAATNLDFGSGFDVTSSPAGEANVVIDYTEDNPILGTETAGDFVQNITAGTGLTSTGGTTGENIAHSLSVDASQTQITAVGTIATGTWNGTSIADANLDDNITVAGGTIGTSAITLVQSAAPAPTAEGVIEWETDDDHIIVGDSVAQVEFVPAEDVSGAIVMDDAGATTLQADIVGLAEIADSACGTNQILEDQGAAWVCINTPSGAFTNFDITDTDASPIQTVDDGEQVQYIGSGTVTVALTADAANHDVTITGSAHTTASGIAMGGDVSGNADAAQVDDVQSATANTEAADNNTTQVATTAFVQQEISNDTTHEPADADIAKINETEVITGDWDFSGGGIEIENGITPPACTEGQLYLDTDATAGQQLMACDGGTFVVQGDGDSGGAPAFNTVTAGTNTNALLVGAAGSFGPTSTGEIIATGQQLLVYNNSGSAIAAGKAVYASAWNTGQNLFEILLADNDGSSTYPVVGITPAQINNTTAGFIQIDGEIRDIDTSSFTANTDVYLSATAGDLTSTKPTTVGACIQSVGRVGRSHASLGTLNITGAGRCNDIPLELETETFIVETATTSDDLRVKAKRALTVRELDCVATGGTTPSAQLVTVMECSNAAASCATTGLTITASALTTNYNDNTTSNGSIDSGDWWGLDATSLTTAADYLHCTVAFTYD